MSIFQFVYSPDKLGYVLVCVPVRHIPAQAVPHNELLYTSLYSRRVQPRYKSVAGVVGRVLHLQSRHDPVEP